MAEKNFLIIYGHPGSKGFSFYFLKEVLDILGLKKINFEILDLYKINYDPVMKIEEHYTSGNKNISEQNLEIQQKIKESSGMIFIYPIWWGGMPAIMKGFIDRVFTSGFAFKYGVNKILKFVPVKLLKDKKIIVFNSLGGPKVFYKLLLDPFKLINKIIIFGLFCKKVKTYQIYSASRITDKRIAEIKKITQKGINWLLK